LVVQHDATVWIISIIFVVILIAWFVLGGFMARTSLALSIKKIYYAEIKNGFKKIEYRSNTPYFQKTLNPPPKILKLHYFRSNYLECEIKKVELVDVPEKYKGLEFLKTDKLFAIHLGEVKEFEKSI